MAILYLIPVVLSESGFDQIPVSVINAVKSCNSFIAERSKTARRYIKTLIPEFQFNQHEFYEIDKHNPERLLSIEQILRRNENIGLLSEAGLPGIADPGSRIVRKARDYGYTIKPLAGPSSLFLALMASGLEAQQFLFHGYLPVNEMDLRKQLIDIQRSVETTGISHLFIETPYRNQRLLDYLLKYLTKTLILSVSIDLTGQNEMINTMPLENWKGFIFPPKRPACFVLGKYP